MSNPVNDQRRRLLGGTAALGGLALLGMSGVDRVRGADASVALPSTSAVRKMPSASFGRPRQIEAGELTIGYVELGPPRGPAIILLHGWPHDIHSFADVAPLLAAQGYRVIVPFLRGFGTTRLLLENTPRNGQQSIFAVDIIALMDALRIQNAVIAGFDWGGRAGNIIAALWPERCRALVSVSGYLIGSQEAYRQPSAPQAEIQAWFQYYFATERGAAGYAEHRSELNRLIWKNASPRFEFDDETYLRTPSSFDNPDHVSIVIDNYRWRLGLTHGESRYDELEKRLAQTPPISVPTITLEGDANGAPHQPATAYARQFTGRYQHREVTGGIGHNLPQEAPKAFADAVLQVVSL
jgi:pimeloyl-ACP methyl ester carboxylesterase